ncbi:hypothetical protein CCH79_00020272 [Gambusia affinis]|uniref:Uncharacterized protein n=1 Tax=Gambusia affinis TaxID=33528 RepID=A0A315VCX4_GAMAF|nr:hypothetical protein CCH79_00020272 [Gambusia affinis]
MSSDVLLLLLTCRPGEITWTLNQDDLATWENVQVVRQNELQVIRAEDKAPPTSGSPDGHRRHPIREELHGVVSLPGSRDGPSRLSLHRLLSSVKLSRTRTGSLDRLVPPVPERLSSDGRKSCSLWKKSPSAQSLCGALELQMKKSSSVQSFGSEESKNCSVDYGPADEQ